MTQQSQSAALSGAPSSSASGSSSSSSSPLSHSASLFRPPVSPAPDSPGVLDSYALVRQSELGSSHLLQSPARTKPSNGHSAALQQQTRLEETHFLLDHDGHHAIDAAAAAEGGQAEQGEEGEEDAGGGEYTGLLHEHMANGRA